MFPTRTNAQIEEIVAEWMARGPSFLWAPTTPDTWLLDRARGVTGRVFGDGAGIDAGGVTNVVSNSASGVEFPTVAGIGTAFIGIMLVSVRDPAAITGSMLKIGSTANGFGFGAGSSSFDNVGGKAILLEENVAFYTAAAGATSFFSAGLNIIVFGRTAVRTFLMNNYSGTYREAAYVGNAGAITPTSSISVNGYSTTRGSNTRVHAVALYPKSLTDSAYAAERLALALTAYRRAFDAEAWTNSPNIFRPGRRWTGVEPAIAPPSGFKPAWVSQRARSIGTGLR